ncbi:MAG: methyltransferase [Dehalococcoidia bacterium]
MASQGQGDWFADGEAYQGYVGRWSRRVGDMFLDWLSLPSGLRWVEVGCGTGALTESILKHVDPGSVTGTKPSEGFLNMARGRIHDKRAVQVWRRDVNSSQRRRSGRVSGRPRVELCA